MVTYNFGTFFKVTNIPSWLGTFYAHSFLHLCFKMFVKCSNCSKLPPVRNIIIQIISET